MNAEAYIFADFGKGHVQYPSDDTALVYSEYGRTASEDITFVLERMNERGNVYVYSYAVKLSGGGYFGVGFVVNDYVSMDMKGLYDKMAQVIRDCIKDEVLIKYVRNSYNDELMVVGAAEDLLSKEKYVHKLLGRVQAVTQEWKRERMRVSTYESDGRNNIPEEIRNLTDESVERQLKYSNAILYKPYGYETVLGGELKWLIGTRKDIQASYLKKWENKEGELKKQEEEQERKYKEKLLQLEEKEANRKMTHKNAMAKVDEKIQEGIDAGIKEQFDKQFEDRIKLLEAKESSVEERLKEVEKRERSVSGKDADAMRRKIEELEKQLGEEKRRAEWRWKDLCEKKEELNLVNNCYLNALKSLNRNSGQLTVIYCQVANTESNGIIVSDYGVPIHSKDTLYLKPKCKIHAVSKGEYTIQIKLFENGILSQGNDSPEGYSNTSTITVKINNSIDYYTLNGWGSKTKGNWPAGTYRYEFYVNDNIIGYDGFEVIE